MEIINNSEINGNLKLTGDNESLIIRNSKINKKLNIQNISNIVLNGNPLVDISLLDGKCKCIPIDECFFKDIFIKTANTVSIDAINIDGNLDLLGEQYQRLVVPL